MVDLYAENFSVEEIEGIVEFYRTPMGKKFLEITPALTKSAAQIGMVEAQDKQQALLDRLGPFMEKHKK